MRICHIGFIRKPCFARESIRGCPPTQSNLQRISPFSTPRGTFEVFSAPWKVSKEAGNEWSTLAIWFVTSVLTADYVARGRAVRLGISSFRGLMLNPTFGLLAMLVVTIQALLLERGSV